MGTLTRWLLRLAAVGVVVGVLILLVHALSLGDKVGSSMVTEPDKGEIFVKLEYPTWHSLERTRERVWGL